MFFRNMFLRSLQVFAAAGVLLLFFWRKVFAFVCRFGMIVVVC